MYHSPFDEKDCIVECPEGYKADSMGEKKCIHTSTNCSGNCAECLPDGTCITCMDGYYHDQFDHTLCVQISTNCSGNCAECLSDGYCNFCILGY